ncbi:MAG: (d)CMP kinase [Candidatus Omnitrophica bacterium]|nr:(d)CMP kinase [Candidatus Omnitrophota bacterium]
MRFFKGAGAIAIDGPAGSGKSTVSRLVAEKLGYVHIDTGAMYRALTLKVMKKGIDLTSEKETTALSADIDIEFLPSDEKGAAARVIMDGEDVSEAIRSMEITGNVKYVARIAEVRKNLVDLQRKMAGDAGCAVMEGRDIGTVVLPHARHKIYLDASFEERITRRFAELRAKGSPVTLSEVEEDLKQRDHTDKTRKEGPLMKAGDAVLIDTTGLTIDQVVSSIIERVREHKA